jgi:hypothetical protein
MMMYMQSCIQMHTNIYSWKLGLGFVLLAKVCPWALFFDAGTLLHFKLRRPVKIRLCNIVLSWKRHRTLKVEVDLMAIFCYYHYLDRKITIKSFVSITPGHSAKTIFRIKLFCKMGFFLFGRVNFQDFIGIKMLCRKW